jgi:hypothetical protein
VDAPRANRAKKPTRRHHYTPVLYLRNFTDAHGVLHVVQRATGERRETSPEAIGFENNLYWPDDLQDGEDPEIYEKQFRDFEGKAAPVIQRIIETREMPTDDDALGILYNFIAFQFVRTPSARRLVAAPREHTARIIIDLLENNRGLYESEMRRSGGDLSTFPFERIQQTKGMYEPKLTTDGFIEGAMTMMNAILKYLPQRTWTVLVSERSGESFVASDHPVVLEWSNPHGNRLPPGHAHVDTELSIPLSSTLALIGCYTPFDFDPDYLPAYVSGVNSRTINHARVFIAAREDRFILQDSGRIITSDQLIQELRDDNERGR